MVLQRPVELARNIGFHLAVHLVRNLPSTAPATNPLDQGRAWNSVAFQEFHNSVRTPRYPYLTESLSGGPALGNFVAFRHERYALGTLLEASETATRLGTS